MAAPLYGIHVWEAGDEWWDLAVRYTGNGLNWVSLAWANPHVHDTSNVPVGTKIYIPEELAE